jgi:hypothetical protein
LPIRRLASHQQLDENGQAVKQMAMNCIAEICSTFSRESPMSCFPLGNELATNDENGGGQPSVVGGLFSEETYESRFQ